MAPNLVGSIPGLYLRPGAKETEPVGNINSTATLPGTQATSQKEISRDDVTSDQSHSDRKQYEVEIVWRNVAIFIVLHALCLYFMFLLLTLRLKFQTFLFKPSTSNVRRCEVCALDIPTSRYQGHLRTLQHRSRCSVLQEEGVELIRTSFRNRLATYRLPEVQDPTSVKRFLQHIKFRAVKLVGEFVEKFNNIKVGVELFGRFILQSKEVEEVKSFLPKFQMVNGNSDVEELFEQLSTILEKKMQDFQEKESGWALQKLLHLELSINKYNPTKASSYIPLPKEIERKLAVLNIQNTDEKCFMWSVLAALHPVHWTQNANRVANYVPFENELDFTAVAYILFSGFGITAGAHRLWAHRSYKANLPLRIFLMLAQSAALQNDIHEWVRDHRVHHKFTDSNADPHNASRGFFFSHMGWLLCKKHKDVITKGKTVDMSDVLADPVVRFQMKYYIPLIITMNILVPSLIPWYFWGEDGLYSFVASIGKYVLTLHGTWLVNSAAHIWGMKPYDESIKPTENKFVAVLAFGEGWHNYHHVFPWDYKAAELGDYGFNFTTCFLDLMAKIGWATELKTASEDMIRKRILRTGDGSWPRKDISQNNKTKENHHGHHHHHLSDGEMIWGWGDKDMDKEEIMEIQRLNRMKA